MSIDKQKAEELKRKCQLQNSDIAIVNTVMNEFLNNEKYKNQEYKNLDYWTIEIRIRGRIKEIVTESADIKMIIKYLYWQGQYQEMIGNMGVPLELKSEQQDYENS